MLMDRYTLLQKIGIYIGIALFVTFILLPFVEMFRTSLSPMSHLFQQPYEIWNEEFSFAAYSAMWEKVPLLGRYIWNSIFIATTVTALTMVFVIPAAYAYARLEFPFKALSLGSFLSVNMFTGAVLLIPPYGKAPIFLLVRQIKPPKRLDLARDAERAKAATPGSIVRNWVDGKMEKDRLEQPKRDQ